MTIIDGRIVHDVDGVDLSTKIGNINTSLADHTNKIGTLSSLQTTDKNNLVNALNEVKNSNQTKINKQSWVAPNGQKIFTLSTGSYATGKGNIEVFLDGATLVSGIDYTETSPTSFTLTINDLNGETVYAKWFESISVVGGSVTVEDNLVSTNNTNALSANQGRVLNAQLTDNANKIGTLSSLQTTDKTNLVNAVNENNLKLTDVTKKTGGFINLGQYNLTDYADVIQSAINSNINVLIPSGTFLIGKEIIWDGNVDIYGLSQHSSILKAKSGFVGTTMISTNTTGSKKFGTLQNFTVDCDLLVDTGVNPKRAEGLTIKDLTIKHFNVTGLKVGVDGSAWCNACVFHNLRISGDMTFTRPYANYPTYCIDIAVGSMDNNFSNIFAWNAKNSCIRDNGGSNRIEMSHVWGDLPGNFPNYCYELNGIGTKMTNVKADSPKLAGIKFNNFQNEVIGSEILLANTVANGYTARYIEISTNNNDGTNIANNKMKYSDVFPPEDLLLNCTTLSNSIKFTNNQVSSGVRNISSYDVYMNNVTSGQSTVNITFPKPLTAVNYMIQADGFWDCGNVTITNKTVSGFTINFATAAPSASSFVYKFFNRT